MTETTRTIFEKYEIRKTAKQKKLFREFAVEKANELGYSAKVEESVTAKNIIVGNPETAKVVFTAHYDTCPALPFPNFITPKNVGIYILYNIALCLGIFVLAFAIGFGVGSLGYALEIPETISPLITELLFILVLVLMIVGPANKHTANDNTSGVTTLFDIMAAMPEELRGKAAFIFFDNEESGILGSSAYASKHKNVKNNVPVINFDCVSDGSNFIFTFGKKANRDLIPLVEEAYKSESFSVEALTRNFIYPSDQINFHNGVGVASLKKSKRGILYMNRIHTKRDTVYTEENIEFLVNGSVKLTQAI